MKNLSKLFSIIGLLALLVASLYLFNIFSDRILFYSLLLIGSLSLYFSGLFSRKSKKQI